jgi:predicted AlkP superfamily phosphohydrolase/phosphomutase
VLPRPGVDVPDSSSQVLAFDIGEFSHWFKVAVEWEGKVRDGRCKFRLSKSEDGGSLITASQILLDPREVVDEYTHPPELADELSSRFGYYLPSKFLKKEVVPEVTVESAKYASFFYDYDDWDLFYYVFTQTDNIQHLTGFSESTVEVYRVIDRFLGELMGRLPEESTLVIASDHGFKKYTWGVDLNEFFEQIGLLVRKSGSEDIDFDRTMVFQNLWHLYFNRDVITRANLEAIGVRLEPGENPVEAMVKYMESRRVATRNPDRDYPLKYFPAVGGYAGDGPDMLVEGVYDDHMVEFWNLKRPRGQLVFQLMPTEQYQHERDGIFIVWGRHVRSGYDAGSREIEDITPTLLYLLGLPSAADMDGRVIFDVFHEEYVETHESYVVKDYGEIPHEAVAQEELGEPLEKKLRSLGYVK